jgi:hypothetical protein
MVVVGVGVVVVVVVVVVVERVGDGGVSDGQQLLRNRHRSHLGRQAGGRW